MARRREALTDLLREHRAGQALVYGFDRSGSAVEWLTGWPVTREAALLLRPGRRDLLFVCFNNHVPNARRLAPDADVRPVMRRPSTPPLTPSPAGLTSGPGPPRRLAGDGRSGRPAPPGSA
jgi:hypothetical protein